MRIQGLGMCAVASVRLKSGNERRILYCLFSALIVVTLLLFLSGIGSATQESDGGNGSLSVTLDRDAAFVGSIVLLTMKYRLPEGGRIPEKPEIKGLEGLTILKRETGAGQIRIAILIDQLDSWKSRMITLGYLDKEGETEVLNAGPVSLEVQSNLGENPAEARLKPIQDIIPIRPIFMRYLPWAAPVMALILALYFFWRHRRRRKLGTSIEHTDPPHIRAKKEIEALEADRLFEKGHIKAFYYVFSEILRHYLESIRHFPAAEFTTEEISLHIKNEQDRKLLPLLRQSDLVKFADAVPTQAGKEEDVRRAVSYISETGPLQVGDRRSDLSGVTSR